MVHDKRHRAPVVVGPRCVYHGPDRYPDSIRLVVVHDAEGSTARGVAAYGASAAATASWHFAVDGKEAVRCLPDDVIAWAAPGANSDGLQLEICGFARWSRGTWFIHQASLKRSAWVTARWCVRYGLRARWLTDSEVAGGDADGLTTHAQVNRVFKKSDHTDPGANFPYAYFLWLVKRRISWLEEEAT